VRWAARGGLIALLEQNFESKQGRRRGTAAGGQRHGGGSTMFSWWPRTSNIMSHHRAAMRERQKEPIQDLAVKLQENGADYLTSTSAARRPATR